jgi:hypothetical protein
MGKFLKRLLLFGLLLVVVYPVLIFIAGRYLPQQFKPNINYKRGSYGHMYTRLKEAEQYTGPTDVLFLGSSHAYRGFDPRNFDSLKTFNLGSSAQTPIQTLTLLNRYLDRINPKVIVYEVYAATLSIDGTESALDVIANSKNDFESLKMAAKVNNVKVYNTLIYGVINDLLGVNASFKEPAVSGKDTYIRGGYVQKAPRYFTYVKYKDKKTWVLNKKQVAAFELILEKIRSRGIKLILVNSCVTDALYKSYTNNDWYDSLMTSYHAEYYNFNKMISLDDSLYFYDSNHLNQEGVNICNRKLLQILKLR